VQEGLRKLVNVYISPEDWNDYAESYVDPKSNSLPYEVISLDTSISVIYIGSTTSGVVYQYQRDWWYYFWSSILVLA